MRKIQIGQKNEKVEKWMSSLHAERPGMALGLFLAGDRWECVDEVALAMVGSEIVGIATIASRGEMMNGKPTIVAVYVLKDHRLKGIGYELLEATIDYMSLKGLTPIHIDALNSKVLRMINRLSIEKRQKLSVVDQSKGETLDAILEM